VAIHWAIHVGLGCRGWPASLVLWNQGKVLGGVGRCAGVTFFFKRSGTELLGLVIATGNRHTWFIYRRCDR